MMAVYSGQHPAEDHQCHRAASRTTGTSGSGLAHGARRQDGAPAPDCRHGSARGCPSGGVATVQTRAVSLRKRQTAPAVKSTSQTTRFAAHVQLNEPWTSG